MTGPLCVCRCHSTYGGPPGVSEWPAGVVVGVSVSDPVAAVTACVACRPAHCPAFSDRSALTPPPPPRYEPPPIQTDWSQGCAQDEGDEAGEGPATD